MTIKKSFSILFVFALFFVASQLISVAHAATYYVSTSGSDSAAGSQAAPFKTFAKAVSTMSAGDEVKVFPGTYNERLSITKSGNANGWLKFSPTSGTPKIDGNFQMHGMIYIEGDYVEVSGFELTRGKNPSASDGVCMAVSNQSQHSIIRNLKVHDCKGHGVHIEGQDVLAEGNEIWNTNTSFANTGQGSGWGSALKVRVGGERVTLRNNLIYQNYGEGIAATRGKDVLIENNTTWDNFSVNIYVDNSINTVVRNNMSYCTTDSRFYRNGNAARGLEVAEEYYDGWGSQGNNTKFYNNIVDGCFYGLTHFDGGADGAKTRNLQVNNNTLWNIDRTGISLGEMPTQGENFIRYNISNGANSDIYYENNAIDFDHNHWVKGQPYYTGARGTGDINGGQPNFVTTPNPTDPNTYRLNTSSATYQAGIGAFQPGFSDVIGIYGSTSTPSPSPSPSVAPSPSPSPTPSVSPSPSPSTTCAEDINEDGTVGISDYSILVADFFSNNPTNSRSDISGNGIVGIEDYSLLVAKFFQDC